MKRWCFTKKQQPCIPTLSWRAYRACNALTNSGKYDPAIEKCKQARRGRSNASGGLIKYWEAFYTADNKPKDALEAYQKGIAAAQKMLGSPARFRPGEKPAWGKC